MAQTGISIRMDTELKKNFESFCAAVGINMSTALNMFAIACVRQQRIPFEISAQRTHGTRTPIDNIRVKWGDPPHTAA